MSLDIDAITIGAGGISSETSTDLILQPSSGQSILLKDQAGTTILTVGTVGASVFTADKLILDAANTDFHLYRYGVKSFRTDYTGTRSSSDNLGIYEFAGRVVANQFVFGTGGTNINSPALASNASVVGGLYLGPTNRISWSTAPNEGLTDSNFELAIEMDGTSGGILKLFDPTTTSDGVLRIYDAAGTTDYVSLTHNGSDTTLLSAGTGSGFKLRVNGGTQALEVVGSTLVASFAGDIITAPSKQITMRDQSDTFYTYLSVPSGSGQLYVGASTGGQNGGVRTQIFYPGTSVTWQSGDLVLGRNAEGVLSIGNGAGSTNHAAVYLINDDEVDGVFLSANGGAGQVTVGTAYGGTNGRVITRTFLAEAAQTGYTWQGNETTYMSTSGANDINFTTGGTQALSLDSSQNATFAGDVLALANIGTTNTLCNFETNSVIRYQLNGYTMQGNGVATMVGFKRQVVPHTEILAAPYSIVVSDTDRILTNEGTVAETHLDLPTAAAGLEFHFVVQDADGLQINANTGDTIRIGSTVSAAAGFISNTSIGATITLSAINATEWIAKDYSHEWLVDDASAQLLVAGDAALQRSAAGVISISDPTNSANAELRLYDSAGSVYSFLSSETLNVGSTAAHGTMGVRNTSGNYAFIVDSQLSLLSTMKVRWTSSSTDASAAKDLEIARFAAGTLQVKDTSGTVDAAIRLESDDAVYNTYLKLGTTGGEVILGQNGAATGGRVLSGLFVGQAGVGQGFTWSGNENTSIYTTGSGDVNFRSGGTLAVTIDGSRVSSIGSFRGPDGTRSVPGFAFTSNTQTGIWSRGAGTTLDIVVSDNEIAEFNTTGLGLGSTGVLYFGPSTINLDLAVQRSSAGVLDINTTYAAGGDGTLRVAQIDMAATVRTNVTDAGTIQIDDPTNSTGSGIRLTDSSNSLVYLYCNAAGEITVDTDRAGTSGKITTGSLLSKTPSHACYRFSSPASTANAPATPIKAAGTTASISASSDFTVATTNRVTYTGATTRKFSLSVAVSASKVGGSSTLSTFYIYKNGAPLTGGSVTQTLSSTNVRSIVISTIITPVTNDYYELWCETTNGDDVTVQNGNVVVTAVQ